MRAAIGIVSLLGACGSESSPMTTPDDAPTVATDAPPPPPAHLVAYVSGYGPDLAWFDLDPETGTLAPAGSLAAFAGNPSFLAMTPTHLYAAAEGGNRVGAYAIDPRTGALTFVNDVASGGAGPAHVAMDRSGAFALVANYTAGSVAVLPIAADGALGAATQLLTPGANAHQILTDGSNRFALVPCKGADQVAQYAFAADTGTLAPLAPPTVATAAGAGPRHVAFSPDGAHVYLVNELDSTLTTFAYAAGKLTARQTQTTRAGGATGGNSGAEVLAHPRGDVVYTSNRGDDDLAVFRIGADGAATLVANVATGGETPRHFAIDPTGRWLFAANQGSNSVTTFAIDAITGIPAATGATLTAQRPSFIGFVALPPR